ncbi:Hypothetical predicted protein [Mytilus galloprovincialis]|uniref:Uncharacterized protein n=1 Tax=Mytilus galloprovincialis TaxID=29158 RepID=A0A8B6GIT5_MYTGA|nr:Hypothetical predicted protein [Mytilus galloprovincialis]
MIAVLILLIFVSSVNTQSCTYDELTLDDGATHTDKSACKEITCSGGETSEKFIGCLIEGVCLPFGEYKNDIETCKKTTCLQKGNGYTFNTTLYGCTDSNDVCHPGGTTWEWNTCFTIGCRVTSEHTAEEYLVKAGCLYNGKCMDIGQPFKSSKSDCLTYECTETNKTYGLKLVDEKCKINGTCYDLGQEFEVDCFKYKCSKVDGNHTAELVDSGCSVNGQCKPSGQTWIEECTTYTCDKGTTDVLEQQCKSGDKCYTEGESWTEGDYKYTCSINETHSKISGVKVSSPSATGVCKHNGIDRKIGEIWKENCFTMTCNQNYSMALPDGCQVQSESCIPVGQTKYSVAITDIKCNYQNGGIDECVDYGWKSKEGCAIKTCKVDKDTKSWKFESSLQCRWKGECVPEGEIRLVKSCMQYQCEIFKKHGKDTSQMKKKGKIGCSIKGGQILKIDNAENKNLNGCVGEGSYFKIHKRKKCAVFKCNLKGKNKWKTEKLKNYDAHPTTAINTNDPNLLADNV